MQGARFDGLVHFLQEAVVPDAVAVRKVLIVRGIENRTPGRSQMPLQNVLTARFGKQWII